MTPLPTPPDFPAAPVRRIKLGFPVLVVLALCGGGLALRAARHTPAVEYTPAPPSYEEALRAAEAKDAAQKPQAPKPREARTRNGKAAGTLWG
ncbi:MAG TPA: hypothetical protein VJ483_00340 [Holophagaceae bacterium]|nr:hypothetical protein [Holophagaceae bacterium]